MTKEGNEKISLKAFSGKPKEEYEQTQCLYLHFWISDWLSLGRTSKTINPAPARASAPPAHCAEPQPGWLWKSRTGRLHNPSGQPVPVFNHPYSQTAFSDVQVSLPTSLSVPITSSSVTGHCWEKSDCFLCTIPSDTHNPEVSFL